jgi:PhnB protein
VTHTIAAPGKHTTHGTPHGSTSLTPHVVVSNAERAIEFYRSVFDARLLDVTRMGSVIAHAVLAFAQGQLTLSDALEAYELAAPARAGPVHYSLAIYVTDADAVVAKALAAGATLREPLSTFVSGDRFGSIRDPFGVRWSAMTRVEDLSVEESAARVAEWAKNAMAGARG